MKKLLILTSTFPHGTKEPFLESEIGYYDDFHEVVYFPFFSEGTLRNNIKYPKHIRWHSLTRYSKKTLLRYSLRLFFSPIFYKELALLICTRRFNFYNVYGLCQMITESFFYARQILCYLKSRGINSDDDYYLYSYWLSEYALTAILLSKKLNCRYVFSRAHGYDVYESRRRYNYIPLRRYILSQLNATYPVSDSGKKTLREYDKHAKIETARLGTMDYGIQESKDGCYKFTIVSCSWCTPVKRIDRLIQSLAMISDFDIRWYHIGDGPLLDSLISKAKMLLGKNIETHWEGRKSNTEVINFYKHTSIDLFINVSSSEGIPVSIMEALSFGIPIIATNVGGTSEIVIDGVNGVLIPQDFSPQLLAHRVTEWMQRDNNEVLNVRQRARQSWEENYSANKNYRKFFNEISTY